jgi:hypothetical protein
MQLGNVLFILLGAGLVSVGVLVAALADRVRGLRAAREAAPRERASRAQSAPVGIHVVESAELLRSTPAAKPVRSRVEPKPSVSAEGGEDVISALVAAGFKKPIATEATWACSAGERATVESWTKAALQKAGRGSRS